MVKNTNFEVTDPRSLPRPLLREWSQVCTDYRTRVDGDLPWHYKERAQIGFLAAAAWRLKGAALEEWHTEKLSEGKSRKGRGDLWVQVSGGAWHIEAKLVLVWLRPSPNSGVKRVGATLRKACRDASEMKRYKGERRVGVVFAVPRVARKHASDCERLVKRWREGLRGLKPIGAMWHGDKAQSTRAGKAEIWPGILLLVSNASSKAG